jgi:RNA polymerase sigma factor (sigma-70 family)
MIHRKIKTLRTSKAFVSWIFKIVKNQCHRLFSSRWHEAEVSDFEQLISSHDTEALALLQVELVQAIAHLPSAYRQILIMRDIEGFTGAEVAETLGLSLETVKSRLHSARQVLREKLLHWVE